MKRIVLLGVFVLLMSIFMTACSGGAEEGTEVPGSTLEVTEGAGGTGLEETPIGGATGGTQAGVTPMATETTGVETSTTATPMGTATQDLSMETQMPTAGRTQTAGATPSGGLSATQTVTGTQQLPGTGAGTPEQLSRLFGLTVVNQNGEVLGSARDYIVNLCESHLLYIVVRPASSLGMASGESVLIPYEAVSVHGGWLNVDDREIMVDVDTAQLQGAPSFTSADLNLSTVDWENEVITFWSDSMPMTLTSECSVEAPDLSDQTQPAGTPGATVQPTGTITATTPGVTSTLAITGTDQGMTVVNKIAFASKILNFQVLDGNGTPLGDVEEVLVTPETGRLEFVAVRLDTSLQPDGKLVLVPMRALNLSQSEDQQLHLVLLVDTEILKNAPAISDIPDNIDESWSSDAFDYWSQQVQMTREGDQ